MKDWEGFFIGFVSALTMVLTILLIMVVGAVVLSC